MKKSKEVDLEEKLAEERTALSEERTLLSNKRTLFSYIRTALALFLAGIAFIGFSKTKWVLYVGVISIILGFILIIIGLIDYKKEKKKIKEEKN